MSTPRGVRNNNPGNLEATAFTRAQPGFAGVEPQGRFGTFDTAANGFRAMATLLAGNGYIAGGRDTISEIIHRYAPSSENNSTAYINAVASEVGIDPNTPLNPQENPEQFAQVIWAMIGHENGKAARDRYYNYEDVKAGVFSAVGPGPDMGIVLTENFGTVREFYESLDALNGADRTQAVSSRYSTGEEAFRHQLAALEAADQLGVPLSEEREATIRREMGHIPRESDDPSVLTRASIEAMPLEEREAFFRDNNIITQNDEWFDLGKAEIKEGSESERLIEQNAATYDGLDDTQKQAVKELNQQRLEAEEQRVKEVRRNINAANQAAMQSGAFSEEQALLLLLGATLAYVSGNNELGDRIMNMAYHGTGHTAPEVVDRSSHRQDALSLGNQAVVRPVHTGGLDASHQDIISEEGIARLARESGVDAATLRSRAELTASVLNGLHPDIKAPVLRGIQQAWQEGRPVALTPFSANGDPNDQFGFRGKGSFAGVDRRLTHIIEATAREFPLRVRVMSGRRGRSSGDHARGLAVDITLYDQDGNALGNYQNEQNFRAYELFAQAAYLKARELYPDLTDGKGADFNWGGLFGDDGPGRYKYGSNDAMDFRLAANNRFRAGTIMGGLNQRHSNYDNGDILGGSQPFSAEAFAAGMRALETLRLTPEQAAYNRRTMFGVARASGSLEARPDSYFHSRTLGFNVVTLDAEGNPVERPAGQDVEALTRIFAPLGFHANSSSSLAFHVGPDTAAYAGLDIIPGSRDRVPGGLPVIPEEWRHASWQEAETAVQERRQAPTVASNQDRPVIVIDTGHEAPQHADRFFGGTAGEYAANKAQALALGRAFAARGYEVVYTMHDADGEGDRNSASKFDERHQVVHDLIADGRTVAGFFAVHHDGSRDTRRSGTAVAMHPGNAPDTLAAGRAVAASVAGYAQQNGIDWVHYGGNIKPGDASARANWGPYLTQHRTSYIQPESAGQYIYGVTPGATDPTKVASNGYWDVTNPLPDSVPAMLLEVDYLTSAAGRARANDPAARAAYAEAVANGFDVHYRQRHTQRETPVASIGDDTLAGGSAGDSLLGGSAGDDLSSPSIEGDDCPNKLSRIAVSEALRDRLAQWSSFDTDGDGALSEEEQRKAGADRLHELSRQFQQAAQELAAKGVVSEGAANDNASGKAEETQAAAEKAADDIAAAAQTLEEGGVCEQETSGEEQVEPEAPDVPVAKKDEKAAGKA